MIQIDGLDREHEMLRQTNTGEPTTGWECENRIYSRRTSDLLFEVAILPQHERGALSLRFNQPPS